MTGDDPRLVPTHAQRWVMRLGAAGAACAATLALGLGTASAAPPAAPPPGPAAAPAPATTGGTPCAATAKACLDLSHRKAWLTDGAGHVVAGPFAARGGTSKAPTPVGTFAVEEKVKHYWSTEFDAPMPNAVFFQPGIAFHEDSTSIPSNGCVHLSWAASQLFYSTLKPGDRVQVVA
ncbi:L,D-transpeptidase [Actinomycetospora endophytica]|uniref:L,D-transpeptidase n=1 Tax=Actinomycetospora endophytica TaxID=2291215 RepID=A0ABS8P1U2_9PSEU|nr:L,D-transpeptidase [Actinomycetospora endophytica]MCD2192210.1 L,D-transpeptidase [Actinomycetospora endophytica]